MTYLSQRNTTGPVKARLKGNGLNTHSFAFGRKRLLGHRPTAVGKRSLSGVSNPGTFREEECILQYSPLIDRLYARVGGFKDRIAPTRDCRSRTCSPPRPPQFRVPLCLR